MSNLTVVLTMENGIAGLKQTLHSLQRQKFNDFEVLLVDDVQNSNVDSIIMEYDLRIKESYKDIN